MLQGAIIGAVVGLVLYFVQQNKQKKANQVEVLDADISEPAKTTTEEVESKTEA